MRSIILLSIIALTAIDAAGQASNIKSISIRSSDGLNTKTVDIANDRGLLPAGTQTNLDRLLSHIREQADSDDGLTLETAGLTSKVVDAMAVERIPKFLAEYGSPAERELWRKAFADGDLLSAVLKEVVEHELPGRTASVTVEIVAEDGQKTVIASASPRLFMFANPRLGRAIAVILPKDFPNRDLLSGADLERLIAEAIEKRLSPGMNARDRERRIKEIIARSGGKFVATESFMESGTGEELIWNGRIRRSDFATAFGFRVRFTFTGRRLEGFDRFDREVPQMLRPIKKALWFRRQIESNPEYDFAFMFDAVGRSHETAIAKARSDARRLGVRIADSKFEGAIHVILHERPRSNMSQWVVFPDGNVMLWTMSMDTVLGWSKFAVLDSAESGGVSCVLFEANK